MGLGFMAIKDISIYGVEKMVEATEFSLAREDSVGKNLRGERRDSTRPISGVRIAPLATLAFEEARLAHCIRLYESELSRTEIIEKKAQFLLGLITVFLSAVFLKIEFIEKLGEKLRGSPLPDLLPLVLYGSLVVIALASLFGLASIVLCTRIRRNRVERPRSVKDKLFSESSSYLAQEGVNPSTDAGCVDFLRLLGKSYAFTTEDVIEKNKRRAYWLKVTTRSVFTMIIALAVFLAAFATVLILTPNPETNNVQRPILQGRVERSGELR
jgi:hypothetical protein